MNVDMNSKEYQDFFNKNKSKFKVCYELKEGGYLRSCYYPMDSNLFYTDEETAWYDASEVVTTIPGAVNIYVVDGNASPVAGYEDKIIRRYISGIVHDSNFGFKVAILTGDNLELIPDRPVDYFYDANVALEKLKGDPALMKKVEESTCTWLQDTRGKIYSDVIKLRKPEQLSFPAHVKNRMEFHMLNKVPVLRAYDMPYNMGLTPEQIKLVYGLQVSYVYTQEGAFPWISTKEETWAPEFILLHEPKTIKFPWKNGTRAVISKKDLEMLQSENLDSGIRWSIPQFLVKLNYLKQDEVIAEKLAESDVPAVEITPKVPYFSDDVEKAIGLMPIHKFLANFARDISDGDSTKLDINSHLLDYLTYLIDKELDTEAHQQPISLPQLIKRINIHLPRIYKISLEDTGYIVLCETGERLHNLTGYDLLSSYNLLKTKDSERLEILAGRIFKVAFNQTKQLPPVVMSNEKVRAIFESADISN